VFVIVNNGWAISVPVAAQTATTTLAQKSIAAGIPGCRWMETMCSRFARWWAKHWKRRGAAAPVLDRGAHLPSERSHHRRRCQPLSLGAEVKDAWAVEPLIRIREYLVKAGAWNDAKEHSLLQDCARLVDAAVNEYLHSVKPSTDAMFDHLFAALPPHLEEQRATARTYSSSSNPGSDERPGASKPSGH